MKRYVKKLALVIACALITQSLPYGTQAQAADKPAFKTYRKNVYENGNNEGVYSYTLKNVKKGYLVKWSAAGAGKKYVAFDKDITNVSKTTVSNKINIMTEGEKAAKNKSATVTAKVYNAKGSLLATVKDKVTLKIAAMDVSIKTSKIKDNMEALTVGASYDFDRTLVPANSTSKTYWSVTDANKKEVTGVINSSGVFTPAKDGIYTITANVKNSASSKTLTSDSKTVKVGLGITKIDQIAANKINVIFNSNVKDAVTKNDFTIKVTNGSTDLIPKSISFSADGKTVTVVTTNNVKDSVSYTVTCKGLSAVFTASLGDPVTAEILTTTVPVNIPTPIKYALYDGKGIDVSAAAGGTAVFSGDITNGYISSNNELLMTTVGKIAEVTLTYTAPSNKKIIAKGTIVCKEFTGEDAASTQFTVTTSTTAPDFTAADFKENYNVSIDDRAYAYFNALDADGNPIRFDKITYSCSDDETLIISSQGEIIPIRKGTATVVVTTVSGNGKATYSFPVTVQEKRKASLLSINPTSLTMSNAYVSGYEKYVYPTLMDQYGEAISMKDCSVAITELSNKAVFASYDPERQCIVVAPKGASAGSYAFKITVYKGTDSAVQVLPVEVQSVPASSSYAYVPELSESNFDMAINEYTTTDKTVTLRLAKYIGGVFADYVDFSSATIRQGNTYYTQDLTAPGSASSSTIASPQNNSLVITPVKVDTSGSIGEVTKAKTGTYVITTKYYADSSTQRTASVSLNLTDSQPVPKVTVKSLSPTYTMSNALSLVEECLQIASGYFTDCTVTGTNKTGANISLTSGQKIHVETVSIRDTMEIAKLTGSPKKVYMNYVVHINRTFVNK